MRLRGVWHCFGCVACRDESVGLKVEFWVSGSRSLERGVRFAKPSSEEAWSQYHFVYYRKL